MAQPKSKKSVVKQPAVFLTIQAKKSSGVIEDAMGLQELFTKLAKERGFEVHHSSTWSSSR